MNKRKAVMKPLHLEVFKTYCSGGTLADAAEKHGQSLRMVQKWSAKYGWAELRLEVYEKQYKHAMSKQKGLAARLQKILEQDIEAMIKRAEEDKRPLNADERQHLRQLHDRILKEVRLQDDKPTDNHGGPQQVTLVIGGGEANRNLFPPSMGGAKVIDVESEEVTELPSVPDGMEET